MFNILLREVGADALEVDPMTMPPEAALDRALRVLDTRCADAKQRDSFLKAARQWVDNRGRLPTGVTRRSEGSLDFAPDAGGQDP